MPHEQDNFYLTQQKIERGRAKAKLLGSLDELTSDQVFDKAIDALRLAWNDANGDDLSCDDDYEHYSDLPLLLEIIDDLRCFTRYMNDDELDRVENDPDVSWLIPFWNAERSEEDSDQDDESENEDE